ncbi:hypothetical protein SUDANB95_05500 [Actinosynnema sp. ALI-1.44]
MNDPMDEVTDALLREFAAAPSLPEPTQTAPDGGEALATLRRYAEIIRANQRTIICRPEHEEAVRGAVELSGLGGFYDVRASDICPRGMMFIAKEWRQ